MSIGKVNLSDFRRARVISSFENSNLSHESLHRFMFRDVMLYYVTFTLFIYNVGLFISP